MAHIQAIRQRITDRDYYVSTHAEAKMIQESLSRRDIENAILTGRIDRKLTRDARGTRYRIEGAATDGEAIQVICRFKEAYSLAITTVYRLTEAI